MRRLSALLRDESGFTLLEVMLAVLILVTAVAMATSTLLVAQKDYEGMSRWSDRSQQLRVALNTIGEDLAYAVPEGGPSGAGGQAFGWCCSGGATGFTVAIYQPRLNPTDSSLWDDTWESDGWPTWAMGVYSLRVTYRMEGDTLIRIIHNPGNPDNNPYLRQVVITGLDPSGTRFTVDSTNHLIAVTLQTQESEGISSAVVHGEWLVRKIRQ